MRFRRIALYAALATLVYLAALIVTFPAAVAYAWFAPDVSALHVYDINGTVWDGHAGVQLNSITFNNVRWQFDPWALFSIHLGYQVTATNDANNLHGGVRLAWTDHLEFDSMRGTLPVSALQAWLPVPSHSISGMLRVDLAHAELDHARPVAMTGTLDLTDTRLLWPMQLTLGDYLMKFTTDEQKIHGTATDQSGPLHLQASGTFAPTGSYTVSGTLAPSATSTYKLRQALHYIGAPDTRGRYSFSWNGQL